MQTTGNGQEALGQPLAVIVGATRPQLRLFGRAIERAGYRVTVIESLRGVVLTSVAREAELVVYNQDEGGDDLLERYRTLSNRPALVLLQGEQALPSDGFGLDATGAYSAEQLQALLSSHLRGAEATPAPGTAE